LLSPSQPDVDRTYAEPPRPTRDRLERQPKETQGVIFCVRYGIDPRAEIMGPEASDFLSLDALSLAPLVVILVNRATQLPSSRLYISPIASM
jgi:hypothetical protein